MTEQYLRPALRTYGTCLAVGYKVPPVHGCAKADRYRPAPHYTRAWPRKTRLHRSTAGSTARGWRRGGFRTAGISYSDRLAGVSDQVRASAHPRVVSGTQRRSPCRALASSSPLMPLLPDNGGGGVETELAGSARSLARLRFRAQRSRVATHSGHGDDRRGLHDHAAGHWHATRRRGRRRVLRTGAPA